MKKTLLISLCSIMAVLVLFGCGCTKNESADYKDEPVTEEEAKEIAAEYMDPLDVEDITSCVYNEQNPDEKKYDIKFNLEYVNFMISVAEKDGTVLKLESETVDAGKQNPDGSASKDLGIAAIQKIALEQVNGAEESDVYRCMYTGKSEDEPIYDVALLHDNKIYTFEIDPATGKILKQDNKEITE